MGFFKCERDFGLNVRMSPTWLSGTFGVYYRRFDEKLPWNFLAFGAGAPPALGTIRLSYARDTQLFGLSLNKNLGPVNIGSEVSYRKDTALNPNGNNVVFTATPTYDEIEGPRGDTLHALVNGIYLLPATPLWVGGNVSAELSYQRLQRVTRHENLFNRCNGADKRTGCSTRDALGMNVNFVPEWPQAFPGWDLSLPTSLAYGIHGNGPALAGGNEGAVSWSVGLKGKLYTVYEFSLAYIDSYASYKNTSQVNGPAVQNSHNWVSFTFKTSF